MDLILPLLSTISFICTAIKYADIRQVKGNTMQINHNNCQVKKKQRTRTKKTEIMKIMKL